MALISTKGIYGLCAMYELSNADFMVPMQIKSIAQKTHIPCGYLEQILNQLRKEGVVKSVRGAKGGYILNKSSEEILIYDVLVALEGEVIFATYNLENKVLDMFFNDINKKIKDILYLPLSEFKKYENILFGSLNYTI